MVKARMRWALLWVHITPKIENSVFILKPLNFMSVINLITKVSEIII